MINEQTTRRGFFWAGALAIGGWIALGRSSAALAKGKGPELPPGKNPASATDPAAQSLSYVDDAKNVDKKKFPQFRPDQKCHNCGFYTKLNDGWGDCQVIKSGVVAAKGWCMSWTKAK